MNLHFKKLFKARLIRFVFNRILLRKPGYKLDGIPNVVNEERIVIPTRLGNAWALIHKSVGIGDTDTKRPALVLFHGGGFVFGAPSLESMFCRRIANNLDCIVISPSYVLAPEFPFPNAAHQCYEIVSWIAREADRLGIDPERIAVGGHSAGGNLATGVVAQAIASGFPKICLEILDYPFLDGATAPLDKRSPIPKPIINPALAEFFNSCYIAAGTDPKDPLLSPIHSDKASLAAHPPALVITAENDTLRAEADLYATMLSEAGVKVTHKVFLGVDHAFTHSGPKEIADEAWALIEHCLHEAFSLLKR